MLGLSAGLEYRKIDDFKTTKDYLVYMFHDVIGFVAHSQLINDDYRQFVKRKNAVLKSSFDNLVNTYISMNTFFKAERTVNSIKRLSACYIDIDCYKLGLSKESVLYQLENDYFGSKMPIPTFVVDSGRGLYLIWKLRNEDRNALPRWSSVQNYLFETCKELGADPACLDAARILRMPFTFNSKSDTQVKILSFNDLTFSLYDIIQEFDIPSMKAKKRERKEVTFPYGSATKKMRDASVQIASNFAVELPDFNSFMKTSAFIKKYTKKLKRTKSKKKSKKEILFGRCDDLKSLFAMRQGEDCKREIGLFLYRLWLCEATGDFEYALSKTLELNASLKYPFSDKYVISRTYSAEKKVKNGESYNYSVNHIIDILDITEEELNRLEYIKIRDTKENRRHINQRAYAKRLKAEGKDTKQAVIAKRQEKLAKLKAEGKGREEICAILSISKATYQRDLQTIKEKSVKEAAEEVKTLSVKKNIQTALKNGYKKLKISLKEKVSFFNTFYYKSSYAVATARLSKRSYSGRVPLFSLSLSFNTS